MSAQAIQSRVPAEEYHALPGISITRLKEMRRSPQHYEYGLWHPKESKPLTLGQAGHCAVLEPERFEKQFAVWGERCSSGRMRPRNGKDFQAFQTLHAGRTILTADEHAQAFAMQKAVRSNVCAMRYLAGGEPEVTLQWTRGPRECRGRVDWLTDFGGPVLVGLKTARDCRHFTFGSAAAKLGYHLQWAFYFDGYKAITTREARVVEIVVESAPPHAVAVYTIPQDILDQGREEYEQLITRLDECEATGYFPGPQEEEEPLTLPSWAFEAADDLTDLGLEWSGRHE